MLDMENVDLFVSEGGDDQRVTLPTERGYGLLVKAKVGEPVSILVGLMLSHDSTAGARTIVPCPIRLSQGQQLKLYHHDHLVYTFESWKGLAVDPIMRHRLDRRMRRPR